MSDLTKLLKPTPGIIKEVKQAYNRVLKRCNEASKYLDNPEVPKEERENFIVLFRVEVVNVMEAYIKVLQEWGVEVSEFEITGGMEIEQ